MVAFPSSPIPVYPLEVTSEWKTLTSDFESGREQRRQIWTFPKREMNLKFNGLLQGEIAIVWNFFNARKGSYEPFWYLYPFSESYTGEYVGVGDGSKTVFELPSKSTVSEAITVYVDGVDTPITLLSGGGDAGVDRVQFGSAPALGKVITVDFTGIIRYRVRFKDDKLSKELFTYNLYNSGLGLREVRI